MTETESPVIRYLGHLERLEAYPGERFVLTVDERLQPEQRQFIQNTWRRFVGEGVLLLILDKGMKLGVIRTKDVP
jgi:hypothetical protein